MNPQQSLQILDQLAGMVELKRADWQNVQTALMVLQRFINENTNPTIPLEDKALQAERNAANLSGNDGPRAANVPDDKKLVNKR